MVGYFLVVFIFFSGVVLRGNFSLTFWCTSSFKSLMLQIIAKLLNDTSYYMNRFQCLEGYRPGYVFLSLQIESVINFHTVFYKVRKFSENCYMAQPSSNFRFKMRVWSQMAKYWFSGVPIREVTGKLLDTWDAFWESRQLQKLNIGRSLLKNFPFEILHVSRSGEKCEGSQL